MIDILDRDIACSDLEYLLLDDLYEMLETPLEDDTRQAILTIVTFLLSLEHERETSGVAAETPLREGKPRQFLSVELKRCRQGLYAHLIDLQSELIANCCSRSTVEGTRDAVLVWIHRLQRHQRQRMRQSVEKRIPFPDDFDRHLTDGDPDRQHTGHDNLDSRADFVTIFEYKPGRYS
jgi:hypothetical protein